MAKQQRWWMVCGLVVLLASACASHQAPPPRGPRYFWLPRELRDSDYFCVPDGAHGRCRSIAEIKAYLWSLRAFHEDAGVHVSGASAPGRGR